MIFEKILNKIVIYYCIISGVFSDPCSNLDVFCVMLYVMSYVSLVFSLLVNMNCYSSTLLSNCMPHHYLHVISTRTGGIKGHFHVYSLLQTDK